MSTEEPEAMYEMSDDFPNVDFTVTHQVDIIRKALMEMDLVTLDRLCPETVRDLYYNRRCGFPECECVEQVSVWSRLKCGNIPNVSLTYILHTNKLGVDNALNLLSEVFRITGTEEVSKQTIDILLDYLIKTNKDRVLAYHEKEYGSTLLHSCLYGYASSQHQEEWALKLLEAGCNPFDMSTGVSPFMIMLKSSYPVLLHKIEELYPDRIDVNHCKIEKKDGFHEHYWHGRNHLQILLYKFNCCKDMDELKKVRDTVIFMLKHNVDLNHVDRDGRNSTNYLWDYKWMEILGDLFQTLPLPRNATEMNHKKPIYKFYNPSPFAFFLFQHRFDKTQLEDVYNKCRELVQKLGLPNLEDSGNGHDSYSRLSQLISDWGYWKTPIKNILKDDKY